MSNLRGMLRQKLKVQKHNFDHFVGTNRMMGLLNGFFFGRNLTALAIIYHTDKWGKLNNHYYTPHYQRHLKKFKHKRINLLEIGVGGYEHPDRGGNSLRMWKRYFPFGKIFAIDIYDKSPLEEKRIKIFKGSQVDQTFLNEVVTGIGQPLDIIIDDGSHINEHVISTFEYLYPALKKGGIYVIEDVHTSYFEEYGGDSRDLNKSGTMMNYFKKLTDCLNYREFYNRHPEADDYNKDITAIHFYHNLIFIYKGDH